VVMEGFVPGGTFYNVKKNIPQVLPLSMDTLFKCCSAPDLCGSSKASTIAKQTLARNQVVSGPVLVTLVRCESGASRG